MIPEFNNPQVPGLRPAAAKSISIRLDAQDLTLAKQQAAQKGLPYQTYLKTLLHDALKKEAAKK